MADADHIARTRDELAEAIRVRDDLFREMSQKYAGLTLSEVERYKANIETAARRIAALRGALTRMGV